MKKFTDKIKLFRSRKHYQPSDKALKAEAGIFVKRYGKLIKKLSNE